MTPRLGRYRASPLERAFYERLIERGKLEMAAAVAEMRKLLHSIYGMPKHDADFGGALCFRAASA